MGIADFINPDALIGIAAGDVAATRFCIAERQAVELLQCRIGLGKFSSNNVRKTYLIWVELRGFEPLTPSMRTRCATGLRYSP
jgi:hypothetical protein